MTIKRFVSFMLAMLCLLSVAACGRVGGQSATPEPAAASEAMPDATAVPTPEPTPAPTPERVRGAYQNWLALSKQSCDFGACLFADGTVRVAHKYDEWAAAANDWTDMTAIAAGKFVLAGLKSDGTVVVACYGSEASKMDLTGWTDIVSIAASRSEIYGVRRDGTVVGAGDEPRVTEGDGWTDVVSLATDEQSVVGLRSDGSIASNGTLSELGWTGMVAIALGSAALYGLRADGTVAASAEEPRYDVSGWTDIVAISANAYHVVGLKRDGTVVAVGDDMQLEGANSQWEPSDRLKVDHWSDIIAIAAGKNCTLGLRADGTVMQTCSTSARDCMRDWNLWQARPTPEPTEVPEATPTPEPAPVIGPEQAVIWCEGEACAVSIGAIGTDENGNTTVTILSPQFAGLQIRNGSAYIQIRARITAGGQSYDGKTADWASGAITFHFGTAEAPERILVYPADGSAANGVTFDAATKLPIGQ